MAVTNNFAASTLDLNGQVTINQPTALVWGADGRLYVTEADGDVRVLTVAFGDKNPSDANNTPQFYVTEAITLSLIKGAIQNHNDNGATNTGVNRQVTGIDVTRQFDAEGNPVMINGKPAVTIYVTSSDSRIGAGNNGGDINLDTNSGVITKLVQTGANTWDAIDIVRGLPRSEENHATNGLEVIQEIDASGRLVSERMIVASGGNANSGAPSNNFAGQQEQPLSGALLEIDLTMISGMAVQTGANGRKFVYDLPTLNDPTRAGNPDNNDPFGGNDGFNSAKLVANGPVSIYSPGYRNAYDVEITEDGRVWTYDNGGNNSWGGRPIGEAGDNGNTVDFVQAFGYIATNLNNGEGNSNDPINLVNWNPLNKDNFHEVTRSDDLAGRTLSAGQGGAQTFVHDGLTYVYGGHPNPTRAEGALAGLLFSPGTGANNAYLLVSTQDSYVGDGPAMSDYDAVIDWFETVEAANPKNGIYGVNPGDLTKKVLAVTPGVLYNIYAFADGSGAAVAVGASAPAGGTLLGQSGLPADIAQIVAYRTPIEGNYKEGGKTDGALDSGNGSINGLTEYTSTILDKNGIDMSGAIIAAQLNGGNLIIMGRNADGTMSSTTAGGFAIAADRTTLQTGAAPLGLASIGDDYLDRGLSKAFQGSIWAASYSTTQPFIQVFQPNGTDVPLAGVAISSPTDRDLDGVNHLVDPFEFSLQNGYALQPGQEILIDFNPQNTNFPNTISATGLLGAALDGQTPNRDAQTAFEGFTGDQLLDGLYDIGGNILPGGNAPILQIKKVIAGTVVGEANTARDALHTGILPSADTDRIVATIEAKNWIPEKDGAVAAGQLTGMMFGDGTQSNFVRFVFGAVPDGQGVVTPGFEVGYEINDVYTALARVGVPALANAGVETVELRLTLDKANGFAVTAEYRLDGQTGFTALNLGGFVLPQGVLRDVLNGDHTIGSGASARESGAAIGFLAENAPGQTLDAVDFYSLRIQAFEDGTSGSGNAAEAFASQGDLFRGASYAPGAQGGAILKVMAGNNDIDSSNFGVNSFQVENIGDKKISAIFIDATGALYPDTVFDPDGQGGDTAVKPWAVNTSGGTGGYVTGSGYFLLGQAPIPNSGGSGGASNGGFKGAMVKFNPTVDGGFQFGEVVGFSGDMDPNSIAGMTKFNVDSGAIQGWDVGGVSGHEMIGSRFTVLFDDGTTASGQLISDKSNSGSIAIAQQGLAQEQVSLVVNGTGAGGVGTYGGTTPSVIVSGDPGQLVRITMTRGFDPVTNTSNGIDSLVSERLARYDFMVNNAYDEQSVDVVIGSNGTFDASALFTYGAASGTTKGGFTGDTVGAIGFVASAIGTVSGDTVPLGPVTAPIYLNNVGGPVVSGPPVPAAPTISIPDVATPVAEGDAVEFLVSLSGPASGPVTVTYSTVNGSAVAPDDFTAAVSQTVTIPTGQTSAAIVIQTIDDARSEGAEAFFVQIAATLAGAALTATKASAAATIAASDQVGGPGGDPGPTPIVVSLAGVVRDAKGVPLAGLTLLHSDGFQTTTDANGRFNLDVLQGGDGFLTVVGSAPEGTLGLDDGLAVLRAAMGLAALDSFQFIAADVDRDGAVTTKDAQAIFRDLSGLDAAGQPGAFVLVDANADFSGARLTDTGYAGGVPIDPLSDNGDLSLTVVTLGQIDQFDFG